MRIAYCTNVRLPSERAHGHQVAQVCDALVALGHQVTIFAPFRRNIVSEHYWAYYGANPAVQLQHLNRFDPIDHPWIPRFLQLPILNVLLRRALRTSLSSAAFDVLYTRSPALLPVLCALQKPVILELHQLPRRRASALRYYRRCRLICCLTSAMREALVEMGCDPSRVIVAGDAVDLTRFATLPSREAARTALGIKTERLIVGYVGRLKTLRMEKGVRTLLHALRELQEEHAFFGLVVGGPSEDQQEYEKEVAGLKLHATDVLFTGEVPSKDIPLHLAACDILVMPFPDLPHYRLHMSPLKMFEYMAASRVIISSDLPTIRDVLSHETAVLCKAGDAGGLASALRWVQAHPQEAEERAKRARQLVEQHTWERRMQRILDSFLATSAL